MTLGTNEIAPMTMAAGYAAFAANGKYCKPIAITSITSATGKKYSTPSADCTQAIEQGHRPGRHLGPAEGPPGGGTAGGEGLSGRESAGKTGTTNEQRPGLVRRLHPAARDRGLRRAPGTGQANKPLTRARVVSHVLATAAGRVRRQHRRRRSGTRS